ncbi:MAG: hypothetical protein GVY29_04745 [Spirochaetes bacterium]|jgi:hypothetical protein|nr:hypothetical protein [Spirochaetota bacterium]
MKERYDHIQELTAILSEPSHRIRNFITGSLTMRTILPALAIQPVLHHLEIGIGHFLIAESDMAVGIECDRFCISRA